MSRAVHYDAQEAYSPLGRLRIQPRCHQRCRKSQLQYELIIFCKPRQNLPRVADKPPNQGSIYAPAQLSVVGEEDGFLGAGRNYGSLGKRHHRAIFNLQSMSGQDPIEQRQTNHAKANNGIATYCRRLSCGPEEPRGVDFVGDVIQRLQPPPFGRSKGIVPESVPNGIFNDNSGGGCKHVARKQYGERLELSPSGLDDSESEASQSRRRPMETGERDQAAATRLKRNRTALMDKYDASSRRVVARYCNSQRTGVSIEALRIKLTPNWRSSWKDPRTLMAQQSSAQARLTLHDAFERFGATVTPDDKRDFANTGLKDVRDEAIRIERQLRARRTQKNMARLEPFLRGMEHYSKAVEVLCNGTPYLSWIWAPVKLMLMVSASLLLHSPSGAKGWNQRTFADSRSPDNHGLTRCV